MKTRLDEFPVADLSEEYLFLVQDPLTLEWCNAPLSGIKEWLQQVITHEDVHVWSGPWEDYSAGVADYALAASLGKDLCDRIKTLEEAPAYQLPIATATRLGGIKVGSGLSITQDGVLSADDVCYFEQDPDYSGEAHLKSTYAGLRIPGLRFGAGREAFDLDVRNVAAEGETPVYALYTPLPLVTNGIKIGGGDPILTWDSVNEAWHLSGNFYADGFVSAGGVSGTGGAAGIDPAAMWAYLKNTSSDHTYDADLIAAAHIPDVASVYGYLKQADIDPILALIPAQASSTNQLADKAFVNSSIATATATYRGSYNEKTDLNLSPTATRAEIAAALATKMAALSIVPDDNDYCFVEIPTSTSAPTQIERTERYKYNGTGWEYEYTLNNSGFTAVQWAAINSNITAGKVSTYDTVAGYFDANGKLGTSHLPSLYIGKTAVQFTRATQDLEGIGNVTMDNAKYLRAYNSAGDTLYNLAGLNASNYGLLGAANSPRTSLRGKTLYFLSGDSGDTLALYINAAQTATFYGTVYLQNNKSISWKNKPAAGASEINIGLLNLSSSNVLTLGSGLIATGNNARAYNTYLYGGAIYFYTGDTTTGATRKWYISSAGDFIPNDEYRIGSSSHYVKEAYAQKVYLAANTYLEVDSNGYVHLHGDGFYCDGFVSGGGLSTGGGTTGIDALAMWKLLTNDRSLSEYDDDTKIAAAHIPDVAAVYNYVKSADISDMATKTWVAAQNFSTTANTVSNVAVGGSGHTDELAITKGGTTSYLTVPYATNVVRFKRYEGIADAGGYDLNTLLSGGGITSQYTSVYYWANAPANMSYGGAVQVNAQASNSLAMQFAWDVVHKQTQGVYGTGKLWWRDATYHDGAADWGAWHLIYDDTTLTKPVITGLLDAGDGTYLPLSGGTMSGDIILPSGEFIRLNASTAMLGLSSGGVFYCGPGTNATSFLIRSGNVDLTHVRAGTNYTIWDAANSNLAAVNWACKDLSAAGNITLANNKLIRWMSNPAAGASPEAITAIEFTTGNNLYIGYGVAASGHNTRLYGNSIEFLTGSTTRTNAFVLSDSNATMYRTFVPSINNRYDLGSSELKWGTLHANNGNFYNKVNVGAPSSTPATVNVAGTIWASTGIWSDGYVSGGGLSSSSDARLKENIKDFNYSTELLMSLKPREWDWNGKTTMKGHAAGFVAQEVRPLLPYAVREVNYLQMVYDTFHALEVSGLQDHETRIKALEDENRKKDAKIEDLEKEIKRLRAI
ncbi:MAG: tail fiber domain-containing protein [Bacteroidales bacterium]|nr:tail fiber domain-containing protein [Bacteroidales bacterium]